MIQVNILRKQYIKMLQNPKIKIVSFDIFDTILFRNVSKPKDLFTLMGKSKKVLSLFDDENTFAQYRINAEKVAKENNNSGEEINLEMIYMQMGLSKKEQKILISLELEFEKKNIFINKEIEEWIKLAHKQDKVVVFMSDMYLSSSQINYIGINKLKTLKYVSKILVSSELQKRKATGNLFIKLKDIFNINFNQILHIGDNYRSDYEVPKDYGINVLYYNHPNYLSQALTYERTYMKHSFYQDQHIRHISSLQNPYENNLQEFYYNLGAIFFAPVLFEFSHWLHQFISKRKITKIFFMMREGYTFEKYFKILYPKSYTKLMYVSRESSFLASLKSFNFKELDFNNYKGLQLREYYKIFGIYIQNQKLQGYEDILCKNLTSTYIKKQSLLELVKKDFEIQKKTIKAYIKKQRELFIQYCQELGIDNNSVVIDFGGGGTVISRLYDILPKDIQPKSGVLFYQHGQGYKTLVNKPIIPFLKYSTETINAIETIARSYDFIEILLNGNNETTASYTKNKQGEVTPRLLKLNANKNNLIDITESFQIGISNYFQTTLKYNTKNNYQNKDLLYIISRIIELPTIKEVEILGELEYEEGKGSTHFSKIINDEKIEKIRQEGTYKVYSTFRSNKGAYKKTIPWIQGTITKINPNYLIQLQGTTISQNQQLINYIAQQLSTDIKSVYIYGAGEIFKQIVPLLDEMKIKINGVIDSRAEVERFYIGTYNVIPLSDLNVIKDNITIIIASAVFSDEIYSKILNELNSDINIIAQTSNIKE